MLLPSPPLLAHLLFRWDSPLDQPPKAPAYTAPAGPPPSHAQGVGSPALYPNEKQGYTGQEQYHQHQGPAQYGVTSPGVYGGVPPSPHGVRSGDTYGGQSGDHYGQYQQQGYGGGFQQQPPQKQGFLSKLGLGGSKNKQQSHPNYGGYPQQQMMHNGGMMGGGMQGQPMYGQQRRGGGGLGAGGGMALGLGAGMLGKWSCSST